MHPPDEDKTAFTTSREIYCYKVMAFGLKNEGSTFQRMVNNVFRDLIGSTMEVYIDDMLVKIVQRISQCPQSLTQPGSSSLSDAIANIPFILEGRMSPWDAN